MAHDTREAEPEPDFDGADNTDYRSTWRAGAVVREPRYPCLTALNGSLVGHTFRIGAGRLIVGRADDCDVVLNDTGVSRRHALLVTTQEGRIEVEDLGSTNGTTVNGTLCGVRELHSGDRVQFGSRTVFKFEFRDTIEDSYATYLYESATQDRLTGLYNNHYFREQLRVEFAWHVRNGVPVALVLLDIDHFKAVNDCHGHLAGDEILKQVAKRCHAEVRTEDVFARYGGEEFACLLRQTPARAAAVLAERMRRAVAERPFTLARQGTRFPLEITISVGVAQAEGRGQSPDDLIAAADRLLYEAKSAGRNRVAAAPQADVCLPEIVHQPDAGARRARP